jgi:exodeoxyribonuclease VII small subunit
MTENNVNLEDLLVQLNLIVEKMEGDDLNLEDSFKSYEKGINLVKKAQDSLKKIEQKVKILSKKNELEDFIEDE